MTDESQELDENDVTVWLKAVENGDEEATTQLWNYCFPRLLGYSRKKLPEHLRRVLDEEDVALSAFKSFYMAANRGAFPNLENRDELWKLLLCIAGRKAQSYVRHQLREKRGGGQVRGESIFIQEGSSLSGSGQGIDNFAGKAIPHDVLTQFTDDVTHLLDMLKDETIKTIALLRIEGYTVEEIANRLECGKRSVERRLKLIRQTWAEFDTNGLTKENKK